MKKFVDKKYKKVSKGDFEKIKQAFGTYLNF